MTTTSATLLPIFNPHLHVYESFYLANQQKNKEPGSDSHMNFHIMLALVRWIEETYNSPIEG